MKLWIDDLRPAPAGYVWRKSTNEALKYIRKNIERISEISLDHDCGDYKDFGGDFINVLNELERLCHSPAKDVQKFWNTYCKQINFRLHSANPVGVANMRAIIEKNGWKEVK